MLYKTQDKAIIRCDRGDDVIAELSHFTKEYNVQSAGFFGIGACGSLTLSFYDLEKKEYVDKDFKEDLEIVSCSGNIGWFDEKPLIHAHGVFSDRNYHMVGGHVKRMIISATGEFVLSLISHTLTRTYDEKTGLNLLNS